MAFRQPTHAPPRIFTAPEATGTATLSLQHSDQLDELQEWVLFSPGTASATDRAFTASTQRTRRTAGRSRISDYGSLDTAARSYGLDEDGSEHTEAILEDEEDGELDSLDSHLHEFRAEPSVLKELSAADLNASGNPVLPTHDGLGSFRIDRTGLGEGIQEHLYAFEQYNPRRIKRRRESLELGQVVLESERTLEYERIRRIEEWRLEQSQALLDEIQKETKRRQQSLSNGRRSMIHDGHEEEAVTLGSVNGEGSQIFEQQNQPRHGDNEGFWSRITRRVIQDLMGIDDHLLSILFGEALPEDDDLSTTPPTTRFSPTTMVSTDMDVDTWEYRLLHRVARELGLLVNQLSDHPGAFSTYREMQQTPLPYAGLPIIPEVVLDTSQNTGPSTLAASAPEFRPTIQATQPLDIAGVASQSAHYQNGVFDGTDATPRSDFPIYHTHDSQSPRVEFTKEEWEKQLDIKMVFRYLRSRFTTRSPVHTSFSRDTSYLATSTSQDAAARAARVRQHHPLVTRQRSSERRAFKAVAPVSPIVHRRGSSCASQSTKKSVRRNSGSSRHYWDINGSMGSGSLIASGGAWGEV